MISAVKEKYSDAFHAELHDSLSEIGGMSVRDAVRAVVRALARAHAVSPRLHAEFESRAPAQERLQFISFIAGYLSAHTDEFRRPDPRLAAEVFYDVSEALVHGMALRDPHRLTNEDWLDEVRDVLTRYLVAD